MNIHINNKQILSVIPVLLITLIISACQKKADITIGTKNFTEQIILGEIFSQLIENRTGLSVSKRFNLGGTFICFKALLQGEIDIYPEYTGTGLTAILKKPVLNDKEKVYNIVKRNFKEQYNLLWLGPLGFNNTYTITMREKQAQNLKISTISDLKKHQGTLSTGFTSEFIEREDGWPGLLKTYQFKFTKQLKELDPGLMYMAIKEKEVDVICGFATDGRIKGYNLKVLKDDKMFFPPYYAAPLVRMKILEEHPGIVDALNKLTGLITNTAMSNMNFQVDNEGRKASEVAHEFLKRFNLLEME